MVVCPGATQAQALAVAATLRTAVHAGGGGRVGVSAGVAMITGEGGDAALQAADRAMDADEQRRSRAASRLAGTAAPPAG